MPPAMNPQPAVPFSELMAHAERATKPITAPEGYEAGKPVVLVPAGYTVAALGFDPVRPPRIGARVEAMAQESFCRYVLAHKTATTTLFAEIGDDACQFRGVLDYHEESGGKASHCSHVVDFIPRATENWTRWKGVDRREMTQEGFALFLEDNLLDVVDPAGAVLLEIVNTLEIHGTLNFSRAQRLQDRTVKLHFVQEQEAKGGELKLPDTFGLRFPLFEGEPPQELEARLRYKLSPQGAASFRFELVNPHQALRQAFDALIERVAAGTSLKPYLARWFK